MLCYSVLTAILRACDYVIYNRCNVLQEEGPLEDLEDPEVAVEVTTLRLSLELRCKGGACWLAAPQLPELEHLLQQRMVSALCCVVLCCVLVACEYCNFTACFSAAISI
jgi:hypothetical protein